MAGSLFKVGATIGVAFCAQCVLTAQAQDPAVSAVNGKIELSGSSSNKTGGSYRLGGSIAAPLGDSWGVQGDLSVNSIGGMSGAAALHLFTRDPSSYLLGVTAGVVRSPTATLAALGPEGELYFDRFSIEAWAGVANLNYDARAGVDQTGVFALVDVGFYPIDDLRLGIGGSSVLGYEALTLGLEYQMTGLGAPLSLTADTSFGEDGNITATAGLKFYFGEPNKSLIDRHRQDDPKDRGLDLFTAAGEQVSATGIPKPKASDFTTQGACVAAGFTWTGPEGHEYCA